MITWILGQSNAGKSTLANALQGIEDGNMGSPYHLSINLDGDDLRKIWTDLGFSKRDRYEQNLRVAKLAKLLDDQGVNVVVSVICPYKELRAKIKKITNCKFIYIEGGDEGDKFPFEHPELY